MDTTKNNKSSQLLIQGSILAIASLIVRLIGIGYRIPLVNILTDEGSGYYSSAYSVYSFLLIISSYGFPAAISKVVAANITKRKYKNAHILFKASLVLSTLIGAVFSVLLFFGASAIANFIEMPLSAPALRGLAPALFIFSLMSVFRGYFQGMNTMMPTAISQIIEQIFNAIFSIVFAFLLLKKGYDYAAAGSSLGTGMGALFGLIFLVFIYMAFRPILNKRCLKDPHALDSGSILYYWKLLLMISIPMVLGTSAFHLTNVVDLAMFNKALAHHGYKETQIAMLNGILEGKYKIIITLPVSIASAMATASIPSITASLVREDKGLLAAKIDMALRSVLMISIPSMIGIILYAKPIIQLLFTNLEYLKMTVAIMQIGAVSVVFFSVSTISIGLLQGLNLLKIPVRNAILSLGIKVVFNLLFMFMWNFNIYGMVITNIIFSLASSILNLYSLHKRVKLQVDVYKTLLAPLAASLIMGGMSLIFYIGIGMLIQDRFALVVVIPIAMVIYLFSLLKLKAFDEEELRSLPFGTRLLRFL